MQSNFYNLPKDARDELIECVKDALEYTEDVSELHFHAFNEDYFIIGRYEAEKWLVENAGGVFSAIGAIQEYEDFQFGERYTDCSDVEKVCNMFVYIAGEELINELESVSNHWNEEMTDEIRQEILEELETL